VQAGGRIDLPPKPKPTSRVSANLPDPDIIAAEIVEHSEAALQQFAAIAADLKK